jgi:hypothetical protein
VEGWWARQESNPQPSRYERPALTVELQAPPAPALAQAIVPQKSAKQNPTKKKGAPEGTPFPI